MSQLLFILSFPAAALSGAVAHDKHKVLCLHGYAQNGAILRDRSGGFRKPLKKSRFEMTYIDGPYGCTKDGEEVEAADANMLRRAWWRGSSAAETYDGWPEARETLAEMWHRERFDGLLGFSQGAGAAAMLAAELRPSFAILVSGFVPRDREAAASLLAGVEGVPTLHVYGDADALVEPERSRALVDLFSDAAVIVHEGGHMLPSSSVVRRSVVEFLGASLDT